MVDRQKAKNTDYLRFDHQSKWNWAFELGSFTGMRNFKRKHSHILKPSERMKSEHEHGVFVILHIVSDKLGQSE